MRPIIKVLISLLSYAVIGVFAFAQANEMEIPEHLEEITLDNVNRLEPLIKLNLTNIHTLGWSNDGAFLAVGVDQGIWIYSLNDSKVTTELIKTDVPVYGAIKFLGEGTQFIAGDSIYDAASLTRLRAKPSSIDYINRDGSLYADHENQIISVYETQTNRMIRRIPVQETSCEFGCGILSIGFSPDNSYLAYSSLDFYEKDETGIVEMATGAKTLFPLYLAWALNYSPDGSMIAFSVARPGYDGREGIQIVESKTGAKIGFVGISGSNNSPVFSRDGRLIVIGGTNYDAPNLDNAYGTLYFYGLEQFLQTTDLTSQEAIRSEISDGWVNAVAFSPNYRLLATGDASNQGIAGQLILWGVPKIPD